MEIRHFFFSSFFSLFPSQGSARGERGGATGVERETGNGPTDRDPWSRSNSSTVSYPDPLAHEDINIHLGALLLPFSSTSRLDTSIPSPPLGSAAGSFPFFFLPPESWDSSCRSSITFPSSLSPPLLFFPLSPLSSITCIRYRFQDWDPLHRPICL